MEKVRGSIVTLRDGKPVESNVLNDADLCIVITLTDNKGKIGTGLAINGQASRPLLVSGLVHVISKMLLDFQDEEFLTPIDVACFTQLLENEMLSQLDAKNNEKEERLHKTFADRGMKEEEIKKFDEMIDDLSNRFAKKIMNSSEDSE